MCEISRINRYMKSVSFAMVLVPLVVVSLRILFLGFESVGIGCVYGLLVASFINTVLSVYAYKKISKTENDLLDMVLAKDKLVDMVSHDLKNPLAAILMATEGVLEGMGDPLKNASLIHRQAIAMTALVDDLLLGAAAKAGRLPLEYKDISVRELLNDILVLMSLQIEQKGIHIVTVLDGERLCCDPNRVKQILLNLLSNSIKHTPSGGSVTIRCGTRNGQTFFVVEDTGPGIPQNKLKRIFEPFEKGSNGNGHGLGLYIVKSLVEAHNGVVWAESITGKGSSVSFTIGSPAGTGKK